MESWISIIEWNSKIFVVWQVSVSHYKTCTWRDHRSLVATCEANMFWPFEEADVMWVDFRGKQLQRRFGRSSIPLFSQFYLWKPVGMWEQKACNIQPNMAKVRFALSQHLGNLATNHKTKENLNWKCQLGFLLPDLSNYRKEKEKQTERSWKKGSKNSCDWKLSFSFLLFSVNMFMIVWFLLQLMLNRENIKWLAMIGTFFFLYTWVLN